MIPVIISGGSGTRLWPVSRQTLPKQFCDLLDESLYTKTYKRLKPLGEPWTVTTATLKTLTDKALKELGGKSEQVIYEPMARNTAPAVAILCRILETQNKQNEVAGVFPADHFIENDTAFREAVQQAAQLAEQNQIITIGIKPTHPATGYGYIEIDQLSPKNQNALAAKRFREKPNEATAKEFLASGNFLWNAGMFVFKVSHMIELFKQHMPELWSLCAQLKSDQSNLKELYEKMPSQSIDYGIMEKLPGHICIASQFDWSDVGSWDAIADMHSQNRGQWAATPNTTLVDSKNNFVNGMNQKTYALIGAEDLVVVDTEDALLIAKRGTTEKTKDVLEALKKQGNRVATEHRFEIRPWGKFEILRDTEYYKSKVITIDPGAQISYQSHAKRSELWVVVKGEGEVVINDQPHPVKYGSHIHIPVGAKHQIINKSGASIEFVEVQLGNYFGEDDIVRYRDVYGRG